MLTAQPGVLTDYARDKARGLDGIRSIYSRVSRARDDAAELLGVTPEEIGFPLNVAQAMSSIARTLDARGGNVVIPQWEFSSTLYPWVTGTSLDVRLAREHDHLLDVDRVSELVDGNTRAIVVSLVSYYTGELLDLVALRRVADSVGAALIVDASHAVGAVDFDATLADFVLSCGYKWMLGAHGGAIAYCNARRQPHWLPRESGWRSTVEVPTVERNLSVTQYTDGRRFELGNPAILPVLMTGEGVRYLTRLGIGAVDSYLGTLTRRIVERIDGLGLDLLTPRESQRRAGIVSFRVDDSSAWQARLDADGILVWATEGRVRLSPHVYTTPDDVDRALDAISTIARKQR
jgi:cysteine desulfurase / selenocysteine lyase